MLADTADRLGLEAGLSVAMAPTKQRLRGHDRGGVLVDLAVMIADGGQRISDLAVLVHQRDLFGEVASVPTAWQTLKAIDSDALERIAQALWVPFTRSWPLICGFWAPESVGCSACSTVCSPRS